MRILVTADFTEEGLETLRAHGEVVHEPWSRTGKLWMAEELGERVAAEQLDVLVVEVDLVHEEVFEARTLRVVGCCRADPLNVDVETATEEGVPVVSAPGRNKRSVADLAVGLMLALARGIVPVHNRLASGDFDPSSISELMAELGGVRGFELGSATVGLVGLGAVGSETAKRLRAFGSRLIAHDPFAPDARFAELGVEPVGLDELVREADIVSLHCPVTRETRGLLSAERIASMKPTALLINTARHALVDGDALLEALRERRIAGAGLDVFKVEPPTRDDPFLALDNVVVTPHIGGATEDVVRHQSRMVAGDVDRVLRGEAPRFCVNPETLAR